MKESEPSGRQHKNGVGDGAVTSKQAQRAYSGLASAGDGDDADANSPVVALSSAASGACDATDVDVTCLRERWPSCIPLTPHTATPHSPGRSEEWPPALAYQGKVTLLPPFPAL